MTTPLGNLRDVSLRDAWTHEAFDFTPWLAQNLDRLGSVLGIRMELEAMEQPVTKYSADIVARDTQDDSLVLIENQLEWTDHSHLGQIMTYLGGVDARTIVWIAREFESAHLAAIDWLNRNTKGDYRFFAVRLRTVRIGESPIAPIFEIVGRPNEWQRDARAAVGAPGSRAHIVARRREFWGFYLERFPDELADGPPNGTVDRWRYVRGVFADFDLVVVKLFGTTGVGVYIRGPRRTPTAEAYDRLSGRISELVQRTGGTIVRGSDGDYLAKDGPQLVDDVADRDQWPALADWLHENAVLLERTLRDLYG